MLNSLDHYVYRSLDHVTEYFAHHKDLEEKVTYTGKFRPYWGNTVVFDLDRKTIEDLTRVQNNLYEAAERMLAERLAPETMHMTLHGLTEGTGEFPVSHERMELMRSGAASLIRQWQGQQPLQMRGTWIFNMDHKSVVLGLVPNNHDTYVRLMQMHGALEDLVGVKSDFCPHITLAYFKPGYYVSLDGIRSALREHPIVIDLPMEYLKIKNFTDMNHYENAAAEKNFAPRNYKIFNGTERTAIKCLWGKCYILYRQYISGSLLTEELEADGSTWSTEELTVDLDKEVGNMWLEGSDTYLGAYETCAEADQASDEYMDSF